MTHETKCLHAFNVNLQNAVSLDRHVLEEALAVLPSAVDGGQLLAHGEVVAAEHDKAFAVDNRAATVRNLLHRMVCLKDSRRSGQRSLT